MRWIGLSEDEDHIHLRRFRGAFQVAPLPEGEAAELRRAVVLDVETTGLDHRVDSVIELGIRRFDFHRLSGEVVAVGEAYTALQDPGRPLSDDVKRITGLGDADLAGQEIDWSVARRLLDEAQIVVAHNAGFDRPFVDKALGGTHKIWGCSLRQVDWASHGFTKRSMEMLSVWHGFFTTAHRALADADATLHLLTFRGPEAQGPYLKELLARAREPFFRLAVCETPRELNTELKGRRYRWRPAPDYVWFRELRPSELETEKAWVREHVLEPAGRGYLDVTEISAWERFKAEP